MDGRDARARGGVDGRDVSGCDPTVADDTNLKGFHVKVPLFRECLSMD